MNTTLKINTPPWCLPLLPHHRYKGAYGGRGSGKSHHFAERVIEEMVADPSLYVVCIREFQSSISMSVKRLLEIKIKELGVESYFKIQESKIKSKKGEGIIVFNGMQDHTADSIKSLEGFDICWCEEAQSLSHRSLELLRPTIRKEGSEMWFSWNPHEPTDAIDQLLRPEDPKDLMDLDAVVAQVNFNDNPWFPAVLNQEMLYDKRRDLDKYLHVWMGNYRKNSKARVFHNWESREFVTPDDAMHRLGADWGFSNDPTVMIRAHVVGNTMYIDQEAYEIGCEIIDTPALFTSNIDDCEKWTCIADCARPETISHMKKHGFPKMFRSKKGKGSVYEGIEFLKSFDIVVHPRCQHTIDELIAYSWKVDPQTGLITNILKDKKNHVIDALRYANETHRRLEKESKQNAATPILIKHRWPDNARPC